MRDELGDYLLSILSLVRVEEYVRVDEPCARRGQGYRTASDRRKAASQRERQGRAALKRHAQLPLAIGIREPELQGWPHHLIESGDWACGRHLSRRSNTGDPGHSGVAARAEVLRPMVLGQFEPLVVLGL